MPNVDGIIEPGKKKAKKTVDIELHGIWGKGVRSPLKPEVFTPSGWPASATPVLRPLAGKPGAAKRALAEMDGSTINAEGVRFPEFDTSIRCFLQAGERCDQLRGDDDTPNVHHSSSSCIAEVDICEDENDNTDESADAPTEARPKRSAAEGTSPDSDSSSSNSTSSSNVSSTESATSSSSSISESAERLEGDGTGWSHDDREIGEHHQSFLVPLLPAELATLQAEADANGYGKMYVAMGGGRDGLEACAAGEHRV